MIKKSARYNPQNTPLARSYRIPSAFGDWTVEFTDVGLKSLRFPQTNPSLKLPVLKNHEQKIGRDVCSALLRLLDGTAAIVPWGCFDLSGFTEFQKHVLQALHAVPFGNLVTYGQLAARVGRPKAARAVGAVCGANPVPIFIPCHRVVAANGLGGFGPGPTWKIRLLRLEGAENSKLNQSNSNISQR
jgi:O-6-methylguanine DNA methyltransferase